MVRTVAKLTAYGAEMTIEETPERVIAWEREETDPCQRGTVGCSIDHGRDPADSCETW